MALRKIGTVISHSGGVLVIDSLNLVYAPVDLSINGITYRAVQIKGQTTTGAQYGIGQKCLLFVDSYPQLTAGDIVYVDDTVTVRPMVTMAEFLDVETEALLQAVEAVDRPEGQVRILQENPDTPTERLYYMYQYDDYATYGVDPGWAIAIKPIDSDGTGFVASGAFGNGWWIKIDSYGSGGTPGITFTVSADMFDFFPNVLSGKITAPIRESLATHKIYLGYNTTSLGVSGSNLYVKDDGHTHDGRYYTSVEVTTLLTNYLQLAGGTMVGNIVMAAGESLLNVNLLQLDEIATPVATANHHAIYAKSTDRLFHQDGAGVEHTIEWTGHNHNLSGLADVDIARLLDGDALLWDDMAGKWVPGTAGGAANYLPLAGGTMTGRQVLCVLGVTGLDGTYNDYNPAGFSDCQVLKVSQGPYSGGVIFTGFMAATEGTIFRVYNVDPTLTITLKHNDAGSGVANRIFDPLGADIVVIAYTCVDYMYIASRWRPVA